LKKQRPAGNGRLSPKAQTHGGNGTSGNGTSGGNGTSHRRTLGANGNGTHGPNEAPPLPRTNLSEIELEKFRGMLLSKRMELVGDVEHMENEALGKNRSDAAGDLSLMPIHMADIGTDNYEQEFTLGLVANERDVVKEIDAALLRIEQGTYGICLATHKPIAKTRLHIKPWASFCIEYERTKESNGRRSA
jgi:RNA polymerase-binding transcription factor DksA